MRIGVYVSTAGRPSLDALLERFLAIEEAGLHTAWTGHTFEWDALSVLALAGRETSRIELGSWVVPTFPRHPVALAQQALTVQAACGGRLALGIGASHRAVIERRLGIDYDRPLSHMEEILAVLPPLLRGERASHHGDSFRIEATLDPGEATPPPILLAALGPRMLELGGRRADGVAIWLGGARFVGDFALPRIEAGARAAGRTRPRVIVGLPVAVSVDRSAREAAERFIGPSSKLPAYRRVLEREGVPSPGAVAVIGDESHVIRRLEELQSLGITDFNAIPVPIRNDPDALARTLAVLSEFPENPSD